MASVKIEFKNHNNETLAGRLEMGDGDAQSFALFAHCFTCGKDIAAASRISRALNKQGIAVLRFDFTGLGSSDGDFANTNFSSNVEDLIAAAEFLEKEYQAPKLLIGHSLGGAATLVAAHAIKSIKALATIGAPSDVGHVSHLFQDKVAEINDQGQAKVNLAGREFLIKKQFIDDITGSKVLDKLPDLHCALAIFHSPIDDTVSIDHARNIYLAAKHPKSFISLHGADHLLTKKEDSEYAADVIRAWCTRYL